MIVVEQQTWMTLVGSAAFAVALAGLLLAIRRDLKTTIGLVDAKIDMFRSELKGEIVDFRHESRRDLGDTRTELKAEIAKVEVRLISLEDRTYDISTRLPAAPAASSTS